LLFVKNFFRIALLYQIKPETDPSALIEDHSGRKTTRRRYGYGGHASQ
jgi:hypothetical protein